MKYNSFNLIKTVCVATVCLIITGYDSSSLKANAYSASFTPIELQTICKSEDNTILPLGYGWGTISTINQTSSTTQMPLNSKTFSIGTTIDQSVADGNIVIEPQISHDGNALAYLMANNVPAQYNNVQIIPLISLNIVTKTGRHLAMTASPNWLQLGPELSPGHFGILAQSQDGFAEILSADWTGNQINITLVKQLPFKLGITPYEFQRGASISPNWSFIGYTTVTGDFDIYSVSDNKSLWISQNIGDQLPQVIWGTTNNTLAIVNMGLFNGNGKLIRVDLQGNMQIITDLGSLFGPNTRIVDYTMTTNASGKIVLVAENDKTRFLVVVDAGNGQANQLCIPDQTVMHSFVNLQWVGSSNLFTLQATANDSETPLKMVIYSAQTGGYTFTFPVANGNQVWVSAWSDNNTP